LGEVFELDGSAANIRQAGGKVEGLPFPKDFVEPRVVEVEYGIARTGDGVEHLSRPVSDQLRDKERERNERER